MTTTAPNAAAQQQPPQQTIAAQPATNGTNGKPVPIWPVPIEVIGLTGDYESGKTLFALSIAPGPRTLIFDTEKSAGTYASLGHKRVDMTVACMGKSPLDKFQWWHNEVKRIVPNQYDVIVLDTVSEIESGIVDYVRKNPQQFGYTHGQFSSAQALMWGAVKDFWKLVLSDLAARCQTFAFTSHLREKFSGSRPTGEKIPKGKETLMELATLYLFLDRSADKKGNKPGQPSATVIKHRLSHLVIENGNVQARPLVPPRLPIATPAAIRYYCENPPDYAKLKSGERVVEHSMSAEEVEMLKLHRAEAERDAESMRLERLNRAMAAVNQIGSQANQQATTTTAAATSSVNGQPAEPTTAAIDPGQQVRDEQLQNISALVKELEGLGMPREVYKERILAKRGVTSARELTREAAEALIIALRGKAIELRTAAAANQQDKSQGVDPKN